MIVISADEESVYVWADQSIDYKMLPIAFNLIQRPK